MRALLDFLDGKKTYIVALVVAVVTFANQMGWLTDDQLKVALSLLAAAGAATMRLAIGKATGLLLLCALLAGGGCDYFERRESDSSPTPWHNSFVKNKDWVDEPITGKIVEDPRAIDERAQNGNGICGRCRRPWNRSDVVGDHGVIGHSTPLSDHSACFPLCKTCWSGLKPEERLPYYRDLWVDWNQWKRNYVPWEVMEAACLHEAGESVGSRYPLSEELLKAWKDAGGMPKMDET